MLSKIELDATGGSRLTEVAFCNCSTMSYFSTIDPVSWLMEEVDILHGTARLSHLEISKEKNGHGMTTLTPLEGGEGQATTTSIAHQQGSDKGRGPH